MKVHLGCFDCPVEGWYNTDITPHVFVTRVPLLPTLLYAAGRMTEARYAQHRKGVFRRVHYLDVRKRFPFADSSVDAFFTSHMLDQIYIFEALEALAEIRRTLKKGGYVRIVLQNLDDAVRIYDAEDPREFLKRVFQSDLPTSGKNQHHWMFTPSYMADLLTETGFRNIEEKQFRETDFPPFAELDNRPEHSFYVEAQK